MMQNSTAVTVTITITSVNDAPVAFGDTYSMDEDTILTITAPGVLANDTDIDGDTLSVILVSTVVHGTLALNADGSFTYTPEVNFFGTDTFRYMASDGSWGSNVVTVTINVADMPDTYTYPIYMPIMVKVSGGNRP